MMTILNRLRSAESGNEQLDILIENALNIGRFKPPHPFRAHIDGSERLPAHPYTTSIDAAIALVEKMMPHVIIKLDNSYQGFWVAQVQLTESRQCKTAPLAILTALFTALEKENEK